MPVNLKFTVALPVANESPQAVLSHLQVNRPVPWVQLKGYWLEAVGFNIDTPIQVRVMKGCLVLTVLTEPQEE